MRKSTILLLAILFIASFLRFYEITDNPKAMYGDELTLVYDAYSILKTGHDQKGNFLPLVFSLGGGRPGGYVYATVPFVAIFGPTALAARMVSVLSGIGIVLLLYFIGKRLLSEKVGLAISAVAALNPWELSLSRGPFETHFAFFLTLFGFYSFIKGFKGVYWFIAFGLTFGLASQTYSTYRLIIPLFTVLLLFWAKKEIFRNYIKKPVFLFSLAIILFSFILSIYLTVSRGNEDRFDIINIFKDPSIRHNISQKVRSDRLFENLPMPVSKVLHTPFIELGGMLAENYISNFLPDFLFLHGDKQPRHNPAEIGGFFWIDTLFLILGIIYLYNSNKYNRHLLILIIFWILTAPLATSLVGGPHALRSSFLLPPLLILTGIGFWNFWAWRKRLLKKVIFMPLLILFITQLTFFIDRFYFIAPKKYADFWSYPAKEAYQIASRNIRNFDLIILSNDIDNMEFAYPVYAKLDPKLVIEQNKSRTKLDEFPFFKYGNIYIGSLPNTRVMQFIKDLPGSVLYIGAGKEQPFLENYRIISGFDDIADLVITSKSGTPELF